MTYEKIFKMAIECFGGFEQERMAIEECAELIQAISHKHRGRPHNIAEEIADVEIMLEQLKIINGCQEKVASIKKDKVDRLYDRIANDCF
jgi:NTP pyrophosphatase (non-canonical NTP hydrolase)